MHKVLVNHLFKLAQEKVWLGELTVPPMTIAVDLGCKAPKQTKIQVGHAYTMWGDVVLNKVGDSCIVM